MKVVLEVESVITGEPNVDSLKKEIEDALDIVCVDGEYCLSVREVTIAYRDNEGQMREL